MESTFGSRVARDRYRPIAPGTFREAGWTHLAALATAPIGASRLIFPRRLAAAVAAHERGETACIASAHARWFFGDTLVFWTDPAGLSVRLLDRVHDGRAAVRLAARFVDAGDWRDATEPVSELDEDKDMRELVEYGAGYPESPTFGLMMRGVQQDKPARRYRSPLDTAEKVHAYFGYFLRVIESIREHGFREQAGLQEVSPPAGVDVRGKFALRQRDIGVAMGAEGRLVRFLGGRHRLAIAQALGIPAVPVELRLVHLDWLADEVRRSGLAPEVALKEWARSVSIPPAARART